ncbi:MAG: MFS transporter [Candidatus Lokiarchaeota archaeon]|nr:MFS transporter [Candidatus Lokiarchaeota archaeon]MBD3338522.1 MFS transporter [Candidatus Lokiarchaeota archaeon]
MSENTTTTGSGKEKPAKGDLPLKVFISIGFGQMLIEFFLAVFGTRVFDYYENEVGLATGLIAIAFILYAVWNMFNDPLAGFIADKPRSFWKKYGKRYLWIIVGGFIWAFSFVPIFAVPNFNPTSEWLFIFLWLLIFLCLYDTLFSIYDVNYNGLIPDKFRTDNQRMKQASFAVAFGVIGTVLGAILPPMLISYGNRASFITMAIIVSVIGLVILFMLIPGIKEDEEMIERAFRLESQSEQRSFFQLMKIAIKQKNFVAYLCIFTFYQATTLIMVGSIPYIVRFILKEEAIYESYIMLGYIVSGLLSIPVWFKIAQKQGNFKRIFLIGGLILAIFIIPLIFVDSVLFAIVAVALIGIGSIGFWVMMLPVLGDVIDEASVQTGFRKEGFYMGVRTFFGRIAIIIQALTFALIHIFTGFEPGSATQSASAVLGLRLQVGLIPAILMLIGLILFWVLYDLTPDKKAQVRKKMKEMDL